SRKFNRRALLFLVQPPERQIVVGICCMMKKSKSKPMTQILERLCRFEYITVVIFPEDVILNEPVDKWPLCDCLISFHSKGFPLDKAVSYAKLRNPLLINDLNMQYYIQDRREVYRILQEEGIDLPRYAVLNRDPDKPDGQSPADNKSLHICTENICDDGKSTCFS
ncbi:inositol hexakisphosphate and diphosphoinositol-pentakisphosphate kinase 2-like, partial [Neolamprologus brichardi]|uniref:inositol hexakisphosphate and diphosphoinositol-pentakisphosphate kinase 2-like n=1 Tax=Neolamprologus brichardi TaxID=32507 RepID=UPI001643F212